MNERTHADRTPRRRPYKAVYTVVEGPRDGRRLWLRIGAAFPQADGSLRVHLDAVPTNGELHVRDLPLRAAPAADPTPRPSSALEAA